MKSPAARLRRTPPERNGPVRNPIMPPPSRSAAEPAASRDPITATGAVVCGALENGVRTAYAVIDEYMRRGQETARSVFNDANRRGPVSDDRGNYPGSYSGNYAGNYPGGPSPANPLSMLTEQWMMAMRPLGQALSTILPLVLQQAGTNPFTNGSSVAPVVTVRIASSRPIEVTANLHPGSDMAGLVSDPLGADGAATPIEAPEIFRDAGGVRVSVKVADKQPAGLYRGLIRRRAEWEYCWRSHCRRLLGAAQATTMSMDGENLVSSVLREYGDATRSVLFRYLPCAEPRRYLYDLAADYPRRGGRSFRPSLCIATARAFGTPMEMALRTAVSIEMMHNAMLIHDDVEDESEQRRGKPAMHVTQGVPIAINVGDMLSLLAMRPLLDNRAILGSEMSLRILEETERMARESAEGQAFELGWRRDNVTDVGEADYLAMVLKKTCWLATIHPSRVGLLIGTGGGVDLDRCIRFGFFLGAAFQIQDDLLNLVGDAGAYGKELGGDLRESKRTLMLIHLLANASSSDRERLCVFLGLSRELRTDSDVSWVRERMDAHGSLVYAREVAQGLAGAAQYEFDQLYGHLPDSRDKRFLEALPTWVIERN